MKPAPTMTAWRTPRSSGCLDAVHVLQVAQREDAGQVDARQRRPDRRGPGREDQLVVGLLVFAARARSRTRTVLPSRSMASTDERTRTSSRSVAQALGRHDQQLVARSAISPPR